MPTAKKKAAPKKSASASKKPAPAKKSAETLGVTHFPVPGVRLNCSTGSYDFHRVDQNTMLFAFDNGIDSVIYRCVEAVGDGFVTSNELTQVACFTGTVQLATTGFVFV